MLYDSLETLPIKLFYKISEDNNYNLLSDGNHDNLEQIWERLKKEYQELSPKTKKIVKTHQKIQRLHATYALVLMMIEALEFVYDPELVDTLKLYGHTIDINDYNNELKRIENENESVLVQIQSLEKTLPSGDTNLASLDKVMASYSRVLGFDIDYNNVSVTKFFALQEQVRLINESNNKSRLNSRRS